MQIETPRRSRLPFRRPLRRGRARLRRGGQEKRQPETVVRVPLGWRGRTYAYVCGEPVALWTYVEVEAPFSGRVVVPVVGFGRGGYTGPLKRAKVVR
jgi:hypothetical protein